MKLINVTLMALAALTITGCSTIKPPCTENERQAILREDARLQERKKVIEGYANGTKEIPGEIMSALTREELVGAYARGFNESLDILVARSQAFNKHCTKGG